VKMVHSTVLLGVLVAVQSAIATPIKARTPYVVKETHDVPRKWGNVGKAPGDHMLHLKIGLKQDRFDELEQHLNEGT
jgi:tripeptidyl-peptidase I